MSTSNHSSAHHTAAHTTISDSSLTNSQRHKVSVLIEPPVAQKLTKVPTVESTEDYAPIAPLSHQVAPQNTPSASIVTVESAKPVVAPPVVWTSGCSQNAQVDGKRAFVSLDFTLPVHLTPQAAPLGAFASVLPFEPVKIEPAVVEAAPVQNAQIASVDDSPTPKPVEDSPSEDTPTPKPVETSESVPINTSTATSALGYSSTFAGMPSRSTGTSPPAASYIQQSPVSTSGLALSYSQAASGKSFSDSSATSSAIRPYAGPSYTTVTTSVASYAGPATSAVSYTSAN